MEINILQFSLIWMEIKHNYSTVLVDMDENKYNYCTVLVDMDKNKYNYCTVLVMMDKKTAIPSVTADLRQMSFLDEVEVLTSNMK